MSSGTWRVKVEPRILLHFFLMVASKMLAELSGVSKDAKGLKCSQHEANKPQTL